MATVKDTFTGMDYRDKLGNRNSPARVVHPIGHARFLLVRKPPKADTGSNLTSALAGGVRSALGLGSLSGGMPAVASPVAVARALAGRARAATNTPSVAVPPPPAFGGGPPATPRSQLGTPPSTTPFTPGATTVISPAGGVSVQPLIPTEAGTSVLAGQRTDDAYLNAIGPKLQDLPEWKKKQLMGLG